MKPEQEGGRFSYFTAGYCPHLVVPPSEEYLGVRVLAVLSSQREGEVFPGQTATIAFQAMYQPQISYDNLQVGTTFNIVEGLQIVGTGRVLRWQREGAA